MIEVIKSSQFGMWLDAADISVKVRVLTKLSRVQLGNFGDHRSVEDGISELRLFLGAGYRVYYMQQGNQVVVVLCAGDKSRQVKDIQLAKQIALEWR